jgi:hypothetical protein
MQAHNSIEIPATLFTEHAPNFNNGNIKKYKKWNKITNVKKKPNNTKLFTIKLSHKNLSL